jgi:glycine cleavage system transcriptional repressor
MKVFKILFLIGKDRPGIVDEVSTMLYNHGANIEDSHMAVLGGLFSITTLFSCDETSLDKIKGEFDRLTAKGFETSLHDAQPPQVFPGKSSLPLKLEIQAMDHPGIVREVVHLLHRQNTNIVSLNTSVDHAPLTGAPLFNMTLEALVPEGTSITKVKTAISNLSMDKDLDLSFRK